MMYVPVRVWITLPETLGNLIPTKMEYRRTFVIFNHFPN